MFLAISEMCKLLSNPTRFEVLVRTYRANDGMNVSILADEMQQSGLGISGVSQYLKQLERIGVVRRVRAGRYVNYFADFSKADPIVATAVSAMIAEFEKNGVLKAMPILRALMNPFRAKVIAAVAQAGAVSAVEICERMEHQLKYLKRDLQEAVDAGLLDIDDSEISVAVCHYRESSDPVAQLLVRSLVQDHFL